MADDLEMQLGLLVQPYTSIEAKIHPDNQQGIRKYANKLQK